MEKATYYRADGSVVGVLPAEGHWPATYAQRGFYLSPPEPPPPPELLYCVIEGCPGQDAGFESEDELVQHAADVHAMDVYRNLATGEIVFREPVEDGPEEDEDGPEEDEGEAEGETEAPKGRRSRGRQP
jgi:hypothetical protein